MNRFSIPLPVAIVIVISTICLSAPAHGSEAEVIQLGISEAVSTSLRSNLNLELKKQDVTFAEGNVLEAESSFDALLSADIGSSGKNQRPVTIASPEEERTAAWNAGIQKRFSPGTEIDLNWKNGNLDTDSDIYLFDPVYETALVLGISQPLLKGLGEDVQMADIRSSQSVLEASSFLVDSQAADLAALVKRAYWELVYAHQNLNVLELALSLAQKLRDDTAEQINAGRLASIDIYQPESEVASREEDLIAGERAIGVAEDNLKLLMNSQEWLKPIIPIDKPDIEPIAPELMTVYDNALANRPDLKAAALQIKANDYQVGKAENQILPALNLVGSVGFGATDDTYPNALDRSTNDANTQWSVGVTFSRPFDNSLAKGQLRKAVALRQQSQISYELLKQEIRRTVRTTVRDVELAIKAIEATRKTAVATQKRLEAEQIKFNAGRATTLDVLTAQQDYARSLSAENRTKVVYAQTLAELDRIQGLITLSN